MAADSDLRAAARRLPPGPATSVAVGTTSTTAINLSTFVDQWVWFQASSQIHVRFGATGLSAATTTDVYLPADGYEEWFITAERQILRCKGAATGTIAYASVG